MGLLGIITRPLINLTVNQGPCCRIDLSLAPMPTRLWKYFLQDVPYSLHDLISMREP